MISVSNKLLLSLLCLTLLYALSFDTMIAFCEQNKISRMENSSIRLVFFGDSLTAGYRISEEEAYPGIISEKLQSKGLAVKVENAGVSGDTTSGGLSRLSWILGNQPVSVFVLALGANDGLRGLPPEQTKENLRKIIEQVRKHSPKCQIILAGMQMPPNMGEEYTGAYHKLFFEVAHETKVQLIPFLLEGVAARKNLNLEDGIHPNEEGHRIIAETVWKKLEPLFSR